MKPTRAATIASQAIILVIAVSSARASIDPPWGFPLCPRDVNSDQYALEPLAFERSVYSGIYNAWEQWNDPYASYFFPILVFDEHRDYVRVTRITGTEDGKPKRRLLVHGQMMSPIAPVSMRIDKCNGAMSQVFFERSKLK